MRILVVLNKGVSVEKPCIVLLWFMKTWNNSCSNFHKSQQKQQAVYKPLPRLYEQNLKFEVYLHHCALWHAYNASRIVGSMY